MRLRPISCAAALVVLLGSAAVAAAPPAPVTPAQVSAAPADKHVKRAPLSGRAAAALGPAGELRGMALNDVSTGRVLAATIADFPRMAAEGITSVSVYVYLYLPSPTGTTVSTGPYTPTDAEIELVAEAAQASGLDVHMMPVLLDHATNSWRGTYVPTSLDEFFASYTAQLERYAALADRLGVTLFYVGSENNAIRGHTGHWRGAISAVRAKYSGALSYLSTSYTTGEVLFWDALDLAAIAPYFSMGEDDNPTYERFMSAWREHAPGVKRIASRLPKPLIFGEAGYRSQQQAFAHPSRKPPYYKMPAPAAQADAYRALLDTLRTLPHVYGVTWWRWSAGVGAADTGYSPNGKPAECVLAANWSPYDDVRTAASAPTCDLHALDAALAAVGGVIEPILEPAAEPLRQR